MNELVNRLTELSGQQATDLLDTLALSDIDFPQYSQDLTTLAELPLTHEQQTELARETLIVLAEQNPTQAEAINAMLNHPPPQRFDGGMSIATIVGVVVLLRTHVKIKRNTQGKWELLIEHKPANNSLLGSLIEKIQALLKQQ